MLHVANKLFGPHLSRTLMLSIFVDTQESEIKFLQGSTLDFQEKVSAQVL